MISGKNYIGYQLKTSGSVTHKTINPKLNIKNISPFFEAKVEEVNQAVELASKAFKVYKNVSGMQKAAFLNTIVDEILTLDSELTVMFVLESGLPEGRAQGESKETIGQLHSFTDLILKEDWRNNTIDEAISNRSRLAKSDIRKTSILLGPVSFQNFSQNILTSELKNNNPLNIERNINGITIRKGDSLFKK